MNSIFLLGAVGQKAIDHYEAILFSLKHFFFVLACFWILASWVSKYAGSKDDTFQMMRFIAFIGLVLIGMYYYPTILQKLYEVTDSYVAGFRDLTDNLRTAVFLQAAEIKGFTIGYIASAVMVMTGAVLDLAFGLMAIIFSLAKGLLFVVCPLLFAFLCHKSTETAGIKFLTLSLTVALLPVGIALADFLYLHMCEYVLSLNSNGDNAEAYLLEVLHGTSSLDKSQIESMGYSTAFLISAASVVSALAAFFSPFAISKLLQGAAPWAAAQMAASTTASAATGGVSAAGRAGAGIITNPTVVGAAGKAAAGAKNAVGKVAQGAMNMGRTMMGGSSTDPRNASSRSIGK